MQRRKQQPDPFRRPQQIDAEVDVFPDFSETITGQLEDTVRNLRVLHHRPSHSNVEYENFLMQAIDRLTDELKLVRANQAKLVAGLNVKASKSKLAEFEKQLTAKLDRRVDNLYKLAGLAVTLISLFIAWKVK